ncbi:MAG: hypothetical protein ACTS8S_21585, partial [Giesbergeria sp.]
MRVSFGDGQPSTAVNRTAGKLRLRFSSALCVPAAGYVRCLALLSVGLLREPIEKEVDMPLYGKNEDAIAVRRALTRCLLGMACLAAGAFAPTTCAQPAARAPLPWVDVHLHLVGGRGQQQDYGGAVEAAIREMDRFGMATAIVLPPPQIDQQQVY